VERQEKRQTRHRFQDLEQLHPPSRKPSQPD
jgi:hypothetical protein